MMTWTTHTVTNQVPPLRDINLYDTDPALQEVVQHLSADTHVADLRRYGQQLGTTTTRHQGELANRYPPLAHIWDAQGHRQDKLEFHPAWHMMMTLGFSHGLHCSSWAGGP